MMFSSPEIAEIMLAPETGFRRITVGAIIRACANHYGVNHELLIEPDGMAGQRQRIIVRKRQMAMFLCRELTDASLPHIGDHFGGRDHSTVIHACKKTKRLLEEGNHFAIRDARAIMKRMGIVEFPPKEPAE